MPSWNLTLYVLELFTDMHEVALTIGWLKQFALQDKQALANHRLKCEVEGAVKHLDNNLDSARAALMDDVFTEIAKVELPWSVGIDDARGWVGAAVTLSCKIKRWLVTVLLDDTQNMAEQLSKSTPTYEHVVSKNHYHRKLAKKQLIDPAKDEQLAGDSAALCLSMQNVSATHVKFGLTPALKEDVGLAEKIAFCQSIYTKAREAVMVIAAVRISETMTGKEACDEAKDMLGRRRSTLPQPLVAVLDDIAQGRATQDTPGKKSGKQ
jgi:hypothetical protein